MVSCLAADWISVFLPARSVRESAKDEECEGNLRDPGGIKRKEGSDINKKRDKPIPCQEGGFCEVPVQEESLTKKGRNKGLLDNQRIHRMEKENASVSFGKTFSQSVTGISQEQIPSGEKQYSRLDDGKNFSQRTALTSHRRIHSGEKTCRILN